MTRTFEEVLVALKELDQTDLIELLNISSEELVEGLKDVIERDFDRTCEKLDEWYGNVR